MSLRCEAMRSATLMRPASGATIGDGMYRTKTGSSIVAVIRDSQSIPAPGPEFALATGDVIVAVGTTDGLAAMRDLIRHCDLVALATERRDLMHPGGLPWEVLAGIQPAGWLHLRDGGGMTHDDWAAAWLERYQELRAGAYEQARSSW